MVEDSFWMHTLKFVGMLVLLAVMAGSFAFIVYYFSGDTDTSGMYNDYVPETTHETTQM